METKNRTGLKVLLIAIGIIIGIYIVGIFLFSSRIIPNTFIHNYSYIYDVSFQTAEGINKLIKYNDNQKVSLILPDKREAYFTLAEIKAEENETNIGELAVKKQNKFLWPIEVFIETELIYDDNYPINFDKLKEKLQGFGLESGTPPTNAYIALSDNGDFYIKKEKEGTQIDIDKLTEKIQEKIRNKVFYIEIGNETLKEADIKEDNKELQEKLSNINEKINKTIEINLVDVTESVTLRQLLNFKSIVSDNNFFIDNKKLNNYVNYLADTYDTYGMRQEFITHNGQSVTVGNEGDLVNDSYGFLLDKENTKKAIVEAFNNNNDSINAVWLSSGYARTKNGIFGKNYIEISINEQHLWYFDEGSCVFDTDIVSGLPTEWRHTPKGLFNMFWKDTNVNLKGELEGETWDVDVDYWLSVTTTGVGIHSAPWQTSFGGDAYQYRGSHGCINVSTNAAKWLYENIEIGTPIIIY